MYTRIIIGRNVTFNVGYLLCLPALCQNLLPVNVLL